jgi:hypothetical protein
MAWYDDFISNLLNGAGTPQAGNPNQLGPPQPTPNPSANPVSGAINNINSGSAAVLAAAHRAANAVPNVAPYSQATGSGGFDVGQPLGPANAAAATPMNPNPVSQPTVTIPPFNIHARAQAPPSAPGTSLAGVGGQGVNPWDPQGAGAAAAQRLQNPWDPQGAGWQASQRLGSWDPQGVAMQAAQRMQGQPQAAAPPAIGALANQNQWPQQPQAGPFTMVMRPNAPAGQSGGRGGGGPALSTALDLSGYQPGPWPPPAPPAPRNYNLGYQTPADPRPAARAAPVQRANPFTQWSPADPRKGNPWVIPGSPYAFTGGNY